MPAEIDALDRALDRAGQWIILRRVVGNAPNQINIDVTVRANIRSPSPEELGSGGYVMNDEVVITSPTKLIAAQWPGGHLPSDVLAWLPRIGDKVVIAGKPPRNVGHVDAIKVDDEVVRINMKVTG